MYDTLHVTSQGGTRRPGWMNSEGINPMEFIMLVSAIISNVTTDLPKVRVKISHKQCPVIGDLIVT